MNCSCRGINPNCFKCSGKGYLGTFYHDSLKATGTKTKKSKRARVFTPEEKRVLTPEEKKLLREEFMRRPNFVSSRETREAINPALIS
jgi:hypothetical protein